MIFVKCREALFGEIVSSGDYWKERSRIPMGLLFPHVFEEYPFNDSGERVIPVGDIFSIPIEAVDEGKSFTNRSIFNLLLLGGTGDGKTLQLKNIWWFLDSFGFKIVYFDSAKLDEAARAYLPWRESLSRPAPFVEKDGISLHAFIPSFVSRDFGDDLDTVKHLRKYGFRLKDLVFSEYWMSLGCSTPAADFLSQVVKDYNGSNRDISLADLEYELRMGRDDERIHGTSAAQASRTISSLRSNDFFNGRPLDLMKEWDSKNSVVVAYNDISSAHLMVFDVGYLIRNASTFSSKQGMKVPMFFICGDASSYARPNIPFVELNTALIELGKLSRNYRAKGLNGILEVQDLHSIDGGIAQSFKNYIISPFFKDLEGLKRLNVPEIVIDWLKSPEEHGMRKDKDGRRITWIYVNEAGQAVRYEPFTPLCNHFFDPFVGGGESGS